jgi:hypothetical protein
MPAFVEKCFEDDKKSSMHCVFPGEVMHAYTEGANHKITRSLLIACCVTDACVDVYECTHGELAGPANPEDLAAECKQENLIATIRHDGNCDFAMTDIDEGNFRLVLSHYFTMSSDQYYMEF